MAATSTSKATTSTTRRSDGRLFRNPDGSASTSLRPLSCELSCLQRADGSSLWKSGSTQVLAAVYGPVAPRIPSQEKGDEAQVSIVIKSGRHNTAAASNNNQASSGMLEREWEQLLTSVLSACIDIQAHARTVIEVVLQVIQDDGSVLAASLHAAVAALMDAGVAMTNLPVATTFWITTNHDNKPLILLDPSSQEERDSQTSVLVIVTETEDPTQILATHSMAASAGANTNNKKTTAHLTVPTILSCAQAAAKATPAVVTFWRLAMEQRVTRESQTLWSS